MNINILILLKLTLLFILFNKNKILFYYNYSFIIIIINTYNKRKIHNIFLILTNFNLKNINIILGIL